MKPHRKRNVILGYLVLALVCVGTVELIACRYFAPTLFDTITAPVVHAAVSTVHAVDAAGDAARNAIVGLYTDIETAIAEEKARRAEEKRLAEEAAAAAEAAEAARLQETPENQTSTPPLLNTPAGICDPAVTELQTVGETQLLTGGPVKIIYYHQSDTRWGNLKYGSDKISTHGCGPTAMAMVVSSLTDTVILPQDMARWAVDHGYWARHSGSYHSIVQGTAEAFGLQAESFSLRSTDALRQELMEGKLLVALMGPGHFTQSGHFIILRGVTLSGDILIADPGSPERSLTAWDAQLILDELSKSTASGSPLWLISAGATPNAE